MNGHFPQSADEGNHPVASRCRVLSLLPTLYPTFRQPSFASRLTLSHPLSPFFFISRSRLCLRRVSSVPLFSPFYPSLPPPSPSPSPIAYARMHARTYARTYTSSSTTSFISFYFEQKSFLSSKLSRVVLTVPLSWIHPHVQGKMKIHIPLSFFPSFPRKFRSFFV